MVLFQKVSFEYLLKLGDFRDLARIDVLSGSLASILRAVGKANNISSRSLAGPLHCRIQHSLRLSILWRQVNCWYVGRCLPFVIFI